jgi:hypothetical protein
VGEVFFAGVLLATTGALLPLLVDEDGCGELADWWSDTGPADLSKTKINSMQAAAGKAAQSRKLLRDLDAERLELCSLDTRARMRAASPESVCGSP